MPIKVSVIIPTYNRRELLQKCLRSLENQTYERSSFEVIVVDDGSTDESDRFLKEFEENTYYKFKYIRKKNQGPASARNAGIEVAHGKLIAFTDDDCIPAPTWLAEITSEYAQGVGGVGGRILPIESKNSIGRYCHYKQILERPPTKNGGVDYLITANALFSMEALQKAGGFNKGYPYPGWEDVELSRKIRSLGYELKYAQSAIVYHHHRESLKSLMQTYFRYGIGEAISLRQRAESVRFHKIFVLWKLILAPTILIILVSFAMIFVDVYRYYFRGLRGLTPILYSGFDFLRRNANRAGMISGNFHYKQEN